jgi:hypothetical protein
VIVDEFSGNVALGLAQMLGEAGKEVDLVTIAPMVGAFAPIALDLPSPIYSKLAKAGVRFVPSATVTEITREGVGIADVWSGETRTIPADTVILNMMRKSDDQLYFALKDEGLATRRIGDSLAPRQVDEAVYEGLELGVYFDSPDGLPDLLHYGPKTVAHKATA